MKNKYQRMIKEEKKKIVYKDDLEEKKIKGINC